MHTSGKALRDAVVFISTMPEVDDVREGAENDFEVEDERAMLDVPHVQIQSFIPG